MIKPEIMHKDLGILLTKKCILCGEEFSFMQLHSSMGTITKDSGCMMYEELLLIKQALPKEEQEYDRLVKQINSTEIDSLPNLYEKIEKQRLKRNNMRRRIDFIENDYLKNFITSKDFYLKRYKIEVKVLGN